VSPTGSTADGDRFRALLAEYDGAKFEAKAEAEALAVRDALQAVPYVVAKVDELEKLDKADPPFKTSTLQQQAAIRLRFSSKKTMRIAQELYEGIEVNGSGPVGLITYMRTDSLRISDEAMNALRERIRAEFGERYLPVKPIRYAAGKMAQEAHEAIRPTDLNFTPEHLKGHLTTDQFRLYQLIYTRFLASQMTPAVFTVTDVAIAAGAGIFKAQGKVLKFDGHRRVWPSRSTASRATRSPNRLVTPRADTHVMFSASARTRGRGSHFLPQQFFGRQAESMHPCANAWPLLLQESFSLGAHQSVPGTRSHE